MLRLVIILTVLGFQDFEISGLSTSGNVKLTLYKCFQTSDPSPGYRHTEMSWCPGVSKQMLDTDVVLGGGRSLKVS